MNIITKSLTDNIRMINIRNIDIDDIECVGKLKKIIKKLTNGDKYFFEFNREDGDSFTDEELLKFRKDIPKYFNKYGDYKVKIKLDEERFGSIGNLIINKETYNHIIIFWRYFLGMLFFNPEDGLSWELYNGIYNKIKPEVYGIGIIQNKYADSVFIKGHDGDNLIFVYGPNYDETLVIEVINIIES